MHAENETHAERPLDPLDRLRHDLRSPLTTIHGRAYLLARAVRRAPSLPEDERARLLTGVAAIETAGATMVVVIEDIDGDRATDASQQPDRS
jgi:K+-sensing histidine kinase KdpD